MKKFNIETLTKKPEKNYDSWSVWGEITINDFSERFIISLEDWSLENYKTQWEQGIIRLKKYNYSCLVINVENLKDNPLVETWDLYKENNTVFFQNSLLIPETMGHTTLKLSNFNINNCYQYIDYPRKTHTEDGTLISEWCIDIND